MRATLPGTYLLLTVHTIDRMLERHVSVADALLVLSEADQSYSGYRYGELRTTFQRGDIAVVVAPVRRTVVTVLYRREDEWRSEHGRPSGAVLSAEQRRELQRLTEHARRTHVLAA